MPSILQTQREIIERLERLEFGGCCPENTGLFDEEVATDITPGEGDPPATWGDQNVADWGEWYNHLCGASYRYVDQLIATANQAQVVISEGAMTLAIIAAILSLLSGAGILVVIAYGTAAAGLNAVIQLAGTAVFEQAAIAMTTDKDKIVCGVMNDNLGQVMEDILSPSAWLFYRYVDWQSATNTLWEGGQPGGENLPPAEPTACPDCETDLGVFAWAVESTYTGGINGFELGMIHRVGYDNTDGYGFMATAGASGGSDARAEVYEADVQAAGGLSGTNLNARYFRVQGVVFSQFNGRELQVRWFDDSGTEVREVKFSIPNSSSFDFEHFIPDEPETKSFGSGFIQVRVLANGEPGSTADHRLRLQAMTLAGEYRL